MKALGNAGDRQAIEGLVHTLIDEDRALRQAAETSLGQIDPNWCQSEAAQSAYEKLENSLNDRPPWVRAAALQVLAKLRPNTSQPSGLHLSPTEGQ